MSLPETNARESGGRPRVFAPLLVALIVCGLGLALPVSALALRAAGTEGWHAEDASAAGSGAGLSSVSFADATHGWAVGTSYDASYSSTPVILATTDGGATWSAEDASSAGGASLSSVCFIDANDGWAVGSDEYGAVILATTDGGVTWSAQDAGLAGGDAILSSVAFIDAEHGWAVGASFTSEPIGDSPLILATSDGGATWDAQDPGPVHTLQGMAELSAVTFVTAQRGWAVGDTGSAAVEAPIILSTSDGGLTWKTERAGATRVYGGLYSVSFTDATHGWAVGGVPGEQVGPSVILATHDGGVTWSSQKAPLVDRHGTLGSVCFVDRLHGWAVGDANRGWNHGNPVYAPIILATSNGGATWSAQDATSAGSRGYLGSIAFVDAAHGWAVGGNGRAVVLATTNGGVLPRPSLTKLKPAAARRGSVVTITGKDFGTRRGTNTVNFGSRRCGKYVSWSMTRIRCRVPAKAKFGALNVRVTTTAGTSNAVRFRVKR